MHARRYGGTEARIECHLQPDQPSRGERVIERRRMTAGRPRCRSGPRRASPTKGEPVKPARRSGDGQRTRSTRPMGLARRWR
jgi:hypothetical protein